jgi:hypothetical protein
MVASPRIGPLWLTLTSLAAQPATNVASPKRAVITKRFHLLVMGFPPFAVVTFYIQHFACQREKRVEIFRKLALAFDLICAASYFVDKNSKLAQSGDSIALRDWKEGALK